MARFEFTTSSGKSLYEITDEFVTIGGDAGNHLRLSDPDVAPVHLRLIHGQSGYRLELANTELKVKVNGEECVARALKPNDRIQIGATTLTFVDERVAPAVLNRVQTPSQAPRVQQQPQQSQQPRRPQATAPRRPVRAAPPPARQPAAEHHHHHHHAKKETRPAWVNWAMYGTLAFVVLLVLLKLLGAGSYYAEQRSPEHWLGQAKTELEEGAFTRALDSCQNAERCKPDAETQTHINEMRDRIKAKQLREVDQSTLTLAKGSLEAMEQFEKQYLGSAQTRPAARQLARDAQLWLQRYTEVVRRYPDAAAAVPKVQSLFDRFSPLAQLGQPDNSDDVLFAVDRFLSVPRPLYREALSVIDGYVAAHANEKSVVKLKARRDSVVSAARAEFDRHETEARRLSSSRRFADARKELQAMRDIIVDDGWVSLADKVEREIQAADK